MRYSKLLKMMKEMAREALDTEDDMKKAEPKKKRRSSEEVNKHKPNAIDINPTLNSIDQRR